MFGKWYCSTNDATLYPIALGFCVFIERTLPRFVIVIQLHTRSVLFVQSDAIQLVFHFPHARLTNLGPMLWPWFSLKYIRVADFLLCWQFQRSELLVLYSVVFYNFLSNILLIPFITTTFPSVKYDLTIMQLIKILMKQYTQWHMTYSIYVKHTHTIIWDNATLVGRFHTT